MGLENTMNFSVNYHASEHDIVVAAAAAIICSNPTTDNADCCGSWLQSRYFSSVNRFSTSSNEMPQMWCKERTQMRPVTGCFVHRFNVVHCVSINRSNHWVANRWQWIDDTLHMYRSKIFEKMQTSWSVYCENKNHRHCHPHHFICSNKYPVSQDTPFFSIYLAHVDQFSEFLIYHLSGSAVNA